MQFKLAFLLFFLSPFFSFAVRISGKVTDENNAAVPFAVVFVKGTTIGTTSNAEGYYFLDLKAADYEINFKLIGYEPLEKKIFLTEQNMELNAQLHSASIQIKELKISANAEDPAYTVIREAQKRRKYYLNQVSDFYCDVFIKGLVRVTKYPPKKIGALRVSIGGLIDSTSGIIYLSESQSKYYFSKPNKVHEEMIASKTSGQKTGFSYNRASELDFNFYNSILKNSGLSERGFISPIAPNAFRFYRYKLKGTFYENNELINLIQVIPKHKSDAVFSGIIYIVENSWRIYGTDLFLSKNLGTDWIDTFHVKQEYLKVNDSIWMPFKNNFEYSYAALGAHGKGNYIGVNSNYKINSGIPTSAFTAETITFSNDALNKDSIYWKSKRKVPLTKIESDDYYRRDSIEVIKSSTSYIDSLDKAMNKFKIQNIIDGYTFTKTKKNYSLSLEPMFNNISFNTVQGLVITPTLNFKKKVKHTKNYEIGATGGYGFSNKKEYGYGHFTYNYNTKRFAKIEIGGGKDMLQFNSNVISPLVNTLYTLLAKSNFMKLFEKYYAKIDYQTELANGLVFFAGTEYADRNPLLNTTDFTLLKSNKEFSSNDPLLSDNNGFAFFRNQSFHIQGAIQFTPFQKYYFGSDGHKLIAESNYPSITVFYKKAIKGVMGSDVDLDMIKVGLEGNFVWKRAGIFHYLLEGGQFVNRTDMSFMDWKYFNGNKTLYSNFSGKQFQLLDYYASSSNNKYVELHVEQNFNALLTSKIPVLKNAKIQELVTLNYLLTSDNKKFIELGIGLRKLFVRVDYVFGFDNYTYSTSALRFGFLF